MSLGDSTFNIVAGGGQQTANAATLARAIVQLGVSPIGAAATLVQIGDMSGVQGSSALIGGQLAEAVALRIRSGQTAYAMPVNPSLAGGVSAATTQVGSGVGTVTPTVAPHKAITVKCSTGGAIGTAAFQFSLDGGVTYSAPVTSVASAPWVYMVPGTFCSLSFPTATYVGTKILTVGTDGTVTPGTGWVGTVTQTSSPIDDYEVLCTVALGGALGTAILGVSLDNGRSTLGNYLIPSSGVLVIAGTGLVLTCASTFVTGDTYSFLASCPGFSTSDLSAALTALQNVRNVQFTMVHNTKLPSTAAGAFSALATLDTSMGTAFSANNLDWQAMCECPSAASGMGLGDIVMSGSNAIRDAADTDAVVIAARGADTNRTAIFAGSYPVTSPITGRKQLRPLGWTAASRYVDTEPRNDLSAIQPYGALPIYVPPGALTMPRDESVTPGLDNVQINTARTYRGRPGVFLSITNGGSGFKNCTTQAFYQDAGALRALDTALAKVRTKAQDLLGQRPAVNTDGTIAEQPRRAWSTMLDSAFKRALGMIKGGDFTQPQASLATVTVLASSQLGASPKTLNIAWSFQPLGFVSNISSTVYASGVITVQQ